MRTMHDRAGARSAPYTDSAVHDDIHRAHGAYPQAVIASEAPILSGKAKRSPSLPRHMLGWIMTLCAGGLLRPNGLAMTQSIGQVRRSDRTGKIKNPQAS
jgi:hypothetical protein